MNFKNIGKGKTFLFLCISFIAGVLYASFFYSYMYKIEIYLFALIIALSVISFLFWENKIFRVSLLLSIFFIFGLWRYTVSIPGNQREYFNYYEKPFKFQGQVVSEPDVRTGNIKLEVMVEDNQESILNLEKFLITVDKYPVYNYGDLLDVDCKKLIKPEEFNGFSYDRYLARYDIYATCYYPEIKTISTGNGNFVFSKLLSIKRLFRDTINKGLIEPHAGIIKAMVLGDKKAIKDDLRQKFSQAGISHVVAISGMHISVIMVLILTLSLSLGISRKHSYYFSVFLLFIYILLIGMPASAVRAGIMGFMVLTAIYFGRMNKLFHSLILTAAFLLLLNPKLLRDDIGFQLSFLAVTGIGMIYPKVKKIGEKKLKKIKNYKIRKISKPILEVVIVTLSAQVFTLPIIIYNFGIISFVSIIVNLLVLWTLPFIVILTFLAIVLTLVLPSFSLIFFMPAYLLVGYILLIVNFFVNIPFSYLVF